VLRCCGAARQHGSIYWIAFNYDSAASRAASRRARSDALDLFDMLDLLDPIDLPDPIDLIPLIPDRVLHFTPCDCISSPSRA